MPISSSLSYFHLFVVGMQITTDLTQAKKTMHNTAHLTPSMTQRCAFETTDASLQQITGIPLRGSLWERLIGAHIIVMIRMLYVSEKKE